MARPFDLIINNSVCLFMDNTLIYNSFPVIIQFPYNTVVSAWHILYYWSWITSYSLKVKVWDWGWSSLWIWILNFFTGDLFYLEKWYIQYLCTVEAYRQWGKSQAFSCVSRRIHVFTYMLRQCTCIVFLACNFKL